MSHQRFAPVKVGVVGLGRFGRQHSLSKPDSQNLS